MVQLCVVMVLPCLVPLLSLVLESPEEGGVLVLCVTNLEEALAMHHHLLIVFCAPWCGTARHWHLSMRW
uniref:Secreted protein n=1 Tax=Pavo cristatus TaxID=9049 RepID=A0A8C9G1C5_PAVCR